MEKAGKYVSLKMGVPPATGTAKPSPKKGKGDATTLEDFAQIASAFNGIG